MDLSATNYLSIFLISLLVFFAVDLLWLGVIAKKLYQKELKGLLLKTPNWVAAVTFYTLFIVGLNIFSIIPSINSDSVTDAFMYGALYGFFTYATYDLTNLATLKDWSKKIVAIDMIWGTVLCAVVAGVTTYLYLELF